MPRAAGPQQPGKYAFVGPNYQKYGEQPGYIYLPWKDSYYMDPKALQQQYINQGLIEAPQKPMSTAEQLAYMMAPVLGIEAGKAIVPELYAGAKGLMGIGQDAAQQQAAQQAAASSGGGGASAGAIAGGTGGTAGTGYLAYQGLQGGGGQALAQGGAQAGTEAAAQAATEAAAQQAAATYAGEAGSAASQTAWNAGADLYAQQAAQQAAEQGALSGTTSAAATGGGEALGSFTTGASSGGTAAGAQVATMSPYVGSAVVAAVPIVGKIIEHYFFKPKPDRQYIGKEKEVINSPETTKRMKLHVPEWDSFSYDAKKRIFDQAYADHLLALPGYADKQGNTVKDAGAAPVYDRLLGNVWDRFNTSDSGGAFGGGSGGIGGMTRAVPSKERVINANVNMKQKQKVLGFLNKLEEEKQRAQFEQFMREYQALNPNAPVPTVSPGATIQQMPLQTSANGLLALGQEEQKKNGKNPIPQPKSGSAGFGFGGGF